MQIALLAGLVAGCATLHSPVPGAAARLPAAESTAVILPEPRERATLPQAVKTEVPATADEKPPFIAKPPAESSKERASAPVPVAIVAPSIPSYTPVAAPKPVAPLDLDSLRARLRETSAIGIMAKLELRSQVDALLDRFSAHHAGGQPSAIDALRQSFNALVQKVLTLIREGDPSLAAMLASSREAIWGVLVDPVKFNAAK